jgi:hypothetical protein
MHMLSMKDYGEDSQDGAWQRTQHNSEDGSSSSDISKTSSRNDSGSSRGSDVSDSESSSGEESAARRAGQWPPQAPPKADYLLTDAEAADRAKQNRPGAPQATAPDTVPAPPPSPEGPTGKRQIAWTLRSGHWPCIAPTYVQPPGGSEGGRAYVRTIGHMLDEFREAITQCSARKRGGASLSGMCVRRALRWLILAPQLFLRPALRGGKRGCRK